MSHVRQQIREEAATRISAALPGIFVDTARVYTVQRSPGVIVYTSIEEALSDIIGVPSTSMRELTLTVEIYSKKGSGEFDDEIDTLCTSIEIALSTDPDKFQMCKTWEYRGINVEYSNEGEKAAGVATLAYVFTYRVIEDDPETGV